MLAAKKCSIMLAAKKCSIMLAAKKCSIMLQAKSVGKNEVYTNEHILMLI